MKTIFIVLIVSATVFILNSALAVEPSTAPEPNIVEPNQAPAGDGDVVGTIQLPTTENKKIIKKIMSRKGKPKAEEMNKKPGKKPVQKPATTETTPETK